MIKLFQFAPTWGLMNASPFCMKVEVFLRLAQLPYETVSAMPMKMPKGKLPVVELDGTRIADSQTIIEALQKRYGAQLPPNLRQPPQGAAHAVQRMLEEHSYFAALWMRWVDEAGWQITKPAFFADLPAPVRAVVPALVRRSMRKVLKGQGLGRHTPSEIHARLNADLDALAQTLGADAFFGGAEPATLDAAVYACLANHLWAPFDTPVRQHALSLPTLVAYCARMEALVGRGPRV
jgi:glutathione S-transferase